MPDAGRVVKRNGGNGHGDGPGVSTDDLPRARAKYLTSSTPANDVPAYTLTAEELVALVRSAVDLALDERDAREGAS